MKYKEQIRQTVIGFFRCWNTWDWIGITQYIQKTWNSNNAIDEMKTYCGHKNIKQYTIINFRKVGEAMVDVRVKLKYQIGDVTSLVMVKARVICETAPYKPDINNGVWGVNPISVYKETKI